MPINLDVIAAQIEDGIGIGLEAMLYRAMRLKDKQADRNNFDCCRVLVDERDAEG